MNKAKEAIDFIESLEIPEGPKAGRKIKLAKFQRDFIRGALRKDTLVGVLSVARGNGKSTLTAGLALAELLGVYDDQPRREIITAARTQEQARIIYNYMAGLAESLPEDLQERLHWRRAPYTQIEFDGEHVVKCIAASPKNALGTSPTMAILDERAHWEDQKGDDLESALLSGLGKRNGRCVMISTSAADDRHSFSQWIDDPPPNTFVAEYRPAPGLAADDLESILQANPGAKSGIGSSPKWLEAQAQRAIARGGSALSSFRLYNRNERVSDERRDMLIQIDEWLEVETSELPPREGAAVVGVDLGGSASMSAAALYWPNTGRLESFGAFPTMPKLSARGLRDGVRDRYVEMYDRGELVTMGAKIVPAGEFLRHVIDVLGGCPVACLTADRYRQSEFIDAMTAAGLKVPVVWRGMGWKDGAEDVERFRSAVFDGHVSVSPSLLLRSAMSDAVTVADVSNNHKLAKARATGRIDAAAAAILAVAEGQRRRAAPISQAKAPVWA